MTKFSKGAFALAAATGVVWLVGAPPAWADDEDDAKDACKQIAENRAWDDPKAKGSKESENRTAAARTGGGDGAKGAGKQIAENRDGDDTKAKVSKESENRIVVTMTGERNDNDKERRCVYNTNSKRSDERRG